MGAGKAEIWFLPVLPEIKLFSTCNIQDLTLDICGFEKELKVEAAKNGRSLNAELVHRLERTMRDDAPAPQLRAAIEPPPLSYTIVTNVTDTPRDADNGWRSLPACMRATMWMMAAQVNPQIERRKAEDGPQNVCKRRHVYENVLLE